MLFPVSGSRARRSGFGAFGASASAACYAGGNLLFTIVQVNAAFQGTLWWIIRHKARLLFNQSPHRLLVPQRKVCFVADLLNRVCSVI